MNALGQTKIVAQSSDRITIQTMALKKWATTLSEVRITLPRVTMHVQALEER